MSTSAKQLIELLAQRHKEDLFIPECKNGPSMFGEHLRMDALAIKKSYTKPLTICYEVKVSRSDFMRDEKWHRYKEYCNELYFVVPPKMVLPDEVPQGVGLFVSSVNGTKLYKKKKSEYRNIEIPASLYQYILFSRTNIKDEHIISQEDRWRKWLEDKNARKELGWLVSKKIRSLVAELEHERNAAISNTRKYDELKKAFADFGLDIESIYTWNVETKINEMLSGIPADLGKDIRKTLDGLNAINEFLEQHKVA